MAMHVYWTLRVFGTVMIALALGATAYAQNAKPKFNPALVYVLPDGVAESKNTSSDNAFIASARVGLAKANTDFGALIPEHRVKDPDTVATVLKRVADSGASPIIAVGSQHVAAVLNLAERYPNTQFTVIDGLVPPIFPNVQSILFKDNEGAFLVGFIAAKMAPSNRVGFIGGMDSPQMQNFATGYTQGVKYVSPNAEIYTDMVGNTSKAWNDPEKARALAMGQYNKGAEVIFAAAGGSGMGVLNAANQTRNYAIGVDSNQNGIYPGRVLTSMVKRVDVAVYDVIKRSRDGSWAPGIKYLGIKEGALDYAVDENNRTILNEKLIEEVANAKERIINGIITVNSYSPK